MIEGFDSGCRRKALSASKFPVCNVWLAFLTTHSRRTTLSRRLGS